LTASTARSAAVPTTAPTHPDKEKSRIINNGIFFISASTRIYAAEGINQRELPEPPSLKTKPSSPESSI
jgi:hypothetical protein